MIQLRPAIKATIFIGGILIISGTYLSLLWLFLGPHTASVITLITLTSIGWYTAYLVELDIQAENSQRR